MERIEYSAIETLLQVLKRRDYVTLAPILREGAIIYDEVENASQLPRAFVDVQAAGSYRVERREDNAYFGHHVGPTTWKKFLFPPLFELFRVIRTASGFRIEGDANSENHDTVPQHKYAFIGVRPCDVQALALNDKVFQNGPYVDRAYKVRRESMFVVAVNCTEAGGTCFCDSMGTGPKANGGYDLCLTELTGDDEGFFLLEVGSERGADVAKELPSRPADPSERERAVEAIQRARTSMGRTLQTDRLREMLADNLDHPEWDNVARRCLTCANCTMVCPTCFCSTVEDVTDLTGATARRVRTWDSCFTLEFSYIHGGSIRSTPKSRYRQWMTHKLSRWVDQFGEYGCVGCGRCITWCPVGIDLTEVARAIRERQHSSITLQEEV